MTIRDFINRRKRWNWALLVVMLVIASIAVALYSALVTAVDMNLAASVIAPLAMGITLWRLMHLKCPRCHGGVGLKASMEQANECQNCGINLDEPVVPPNGQAAGLPRKPLTIGIYIRQRATRVLNYLILSIALVGIGIATRYNAKVDSGLLIGILAGGVSIIVAAAVAACTRCPNCATPLGRAGASLMWKKPADHCRACGVKFDQPMP